MDSFKNRIIDKFKMSTEDFTRNMISYDKKVTTLSGFIQNNNRTIMDIDKLTKNLESNFHVQKEKVAELSADL